jgi:hypothetical protein
LALKIMKSCRAGLDATRTAAATAMTHALEFDTAAWQQDVQTIRPLTLRSSYEGYLSAAAGTETNTLTMGGPLSYDMALWLGQVAVYGPCAGVKGVGVDYLWTYLPTHTSDDLDSFSAQFGYSDGLGATQPAVALKNLLCDELSMTWDKSGEGLVSYDAKFMTASPAVQISAFTGAATAIGATYVASANTTAVTIDTTTIGTTADTKWSDLKWTLSNGFKNLYTLNNLTSATATFRGGPVKWKLEGSRYYDNYTEWNAYIAKTPRKVRIKSVGPVVGSSTYYIQLDLYGVYTAMSNDEKDDLGFQKFTLEGVYDTTAASSFIYLVDSGLLTIT